jgi:hypothetical protein
VGQKCGHTFVSIQWLSLRQATAVRFSLLVQVAQDNSMQRDNNMPLQMKTPSYIPNNHNYPSQEESIRFHGDALRESTDLT